MNGDEIAKRVADLRQQLSAGDQQDHAKTHGQMLDLIEALAKRLSEIDHSTSVRLRTSPDGETIDT